MYCQNCGLQINSSNNFCSECGTKLKCETVETPSESSNPQPKTKIEWKAKGMIKIFPWMGGTLLKKKTPLLGEWKYNKGILSRGALFLKKEIDTRDHFKSVKLLEDDQKQLTAFFMSKKLTPETIPAWFAGPIWGLASEKRAEQKLLRDPSVEVSIEGTFLELYGPEKVLIELLKNFPIH